MRSLRAGFSIFSRSSTRAPSFAARPAASSPAGPAPITTTSQMPAGASPPAVTRVPCARAAPVPSGTGGSRTGTPGAWARSPGRGAPWVPGAFPGLGVGVDRTPAQFVLDAMAGGHHHPAQEAGLQLRRGLQDLGPGPPVEEPGRYGGSYQDALNREADERLRIAAENRLPGESVDETLVRLARENRLPYTEPYGLRQRVALRDATFDDAARTRLLQLNRLPGESLEATRLRLIEEGRWLPISTRDATLRRDLLLAARRDNETPQEPEIRLLREGRLGLPMRDDELRRIVAANRFSTETDEETRRRLVREGRLPLESEDETIRRLLLEGALYWRALGGPMPRRMRRAYMTAERDPGRAPPRAAGRRIVSSSLSSGRRPSRTRRRRVSSSVSVRETIRGDDSMAVRRAAHRFGEWALSQRASHILFASRCRDVPRATDRDAAWRGASNRPPATLFNEARARRFETLRLADGLVSRSRRVRTGGVVERRVAQRHFAGPAGSVPQGRRFSARQRGAPASRRPLAPGRRFSAAMRKRSSAWRLAS